MNPESLPSAPDWIGSLATASGFILSIFAVWDSRRSRKAAEESARAAKESNRVAQEALDLEKQRFQRENSESNIREKNDLIEAGKTYLKTDGRRGFKRWFHAHPELFSRSDWFDIIRIAATTKGFYFHHEKEFYNLCKEYQIPLPEKIGQNGSTKIPK